MSDLHLQNDMLQWLIDDAPEDERTVLQLTRRILTINFAAIHTSSSVSIHLPRNGGPCFICVLINKCP